jgi:hydrogenase/urease accessory protein HupE
VKTTATIAQVVRKWLCGGLLGIVLLLSPALCQAHESRPSYLELTERAPGRYEVVWRRPTLGDQALALTPQFPQECRDATPHSIYTASGSVVERWTLTCNETSLSGQSIAVTGLSSTITDVLVRVSLAAGVTETHILRAGAPSFTVRGTPARLDVINSYFFLGVAHILNGIDHLLFVLGLLLIVQGRRLLLKTVTAFTVAHSLTLGVATLGFVHVPQAPVEAVIALSILLLAAELARQPEHEKSLLALCPWAVAFSFGLLHGFGFAGALTEVGLPPTDIPLALLTFNLGVEVGQLLFIVGMFTLAYGARRWLVVHEQGWRRAAAYGIGSVSAFWVIQRVAAFF